jgi:hypothetical protein
MSGSRAALRLKVVSWQREPSELRWQSERRKHSALKSPWGLVLAEPLKLLKEYCQNLLLETYIAKALLCQIVGRQGLQIHFNTYAVL